VNVLSSSESMELEKVQKIYFIGIGGIGMSAIALIMLDMGFKVSGSDIKEGKMTGILRQAGATILIGHDASNIASDTEAVVYTSAIQSDNIEITEAQKRGLPIYQRAQMLAYIMSKKISIGVAGAHGKTTTSGMISLMLEKANLDPTIVIGGTLPQIAGNAKSGKGDYLVAEADESDGTFLLLHPQIAVVTNIESDHLDHYESLQEIISCFEQYVKQLPSDGLAIIGIDCPNSRGLLDKIFCRCLTYGFSPEADFRAEDLHHSEFGISASVFYHGENLGRLVLHVPGKHNIENALAAVALGTYIGLDFLTIVDALAYFIGTGRRFEYLGQYRGAQVVDDYAHHPTEIRTTIQAAKDMGAKRIIAVFQPHRYSRVQAMHEDFAAALNKTDIIIIAEIYPAFEKPLPGINSQLIAENARKLGHNNVYYAADHNEIIRVLNEFTQPDDLILIMGAGDIRSVGEKLLKV